MAPLSSLHDYFQQRRRRKRKRTVSNLSFSYFWWLLASNCHCETFHRFRHFLLTTEIDHYVLSNVLVLEFSWIIPRMKTMLPLHFHLLLLRDVGTNLRQGKSVLASGHRKRNCYLLEPSLYCYLKESWH